MGWGGVEWGGVNVSPTPLLDIPLHLMLLLDGLGRGGMGWGGDNTRRVSSSAT